jgi:hypothetical protein
MNRHLAGSQEFATETEDTGIVAGHRRFVAHRVMQEAE